MDRTGASSSRRRIVAALFVFAFGGLVGPLIYYSAAAWGELLPHIVSPLWPTRPLGMFGAMLGSVLSFGGNVFLFAVSGILGALRPSLAWRFSSAMVTAFVLASCSFVLEGEIALAEYLVAATMFGSLTAISIVASHGCRPKQERSVSGDSC